MSKESKKTTNLKNINNAQEKVSIEDFKNLENKLADANIKIQKYNERIEQLENERKQIAEFYKLEVIKKAKLAQDEVNKKVDEINQKLKKDLLHAKKFAIEDHAIELINIVSQFSNAISIQTADENIKNYLSGFKMFLDMFNNLLSEMHINEINIKIGDSFDEKSMEAVSVVKEKDFKKNSVTKIIKKGYLLHNKVIQFAQVEVNE